MIADNDPRIRVVAQGLKDMYRGYSPRREVKRQDQQWADAKWLLSRADEAALNN